jgi:hypothetical protein
MSTYATLQADVADYLHRTDLTAKIPGFIARAEATMFRELNIKDIQTVVDDVTDEDYITLPADFGSIVRLTTTKAGVERTVDFVSPTERYTNQNQYSFEAGGIRLFGSGNGTAYNLYYTPVIEPLSDDNTTNWLLDNAPDLYLYASALEAAIYIRDTELMQVLSSMTGGLIESVRRLSERKFIPSGSLQIKAR